MSKTINSKSSDQTELVKVDVQFAVVDQLALLPKKSKLVKWANNAYRFVLNENSRNAKENEYSALDNVELSIRLVDDVEIQQLNRDYRGKDKATNVLSFEAQLDPEVGLMLLGDIVLCHSVILDEAEQQNKTVKQHYAHMVTHGVLHLCGYDHQDDDQAQQMESLEIKALENSGFANPYSA